MTKAPTDFMEAVLGPDGTKALLKAAERSAAIGSALLPRTALAWVRAVSSYEGELPGLPGTSITYGLDGEGFKGTISIGQELHKFEGASLFHLAASVAVAVDLNRAPVSDDLRDIDIEQLGKSIDCLADVRAKRMAKAASDEDDALSDEDYKKKHGKERLKKAGMGRPAGAIAPVAPTAPTAKAPPPTAAALKPKAPATAPESLPSAKTKGSSIKLTRSEASHRCSMCGSGQFDGKAFVGCLCLRSLAKAVTVQSNDDAGVVLKLTGWDRESVFTLLESVGRV